MADFLDFDSLELNVDEQVNGAKEHPLKGMKTGLKMAYVGGLLFACHADDNTLQKEERSLVMGVAHSLGVGKEEVDELTETIVGLTDKIGYLKEIVATLKDRKTILFFLCDMIKAMGADGELNENAQKLIGAVEKLAHLDTNDESIVANYQTIFLGKAQTSIDGLNLGDVSKAGVDKSLFDWFAVPLGLVKNTKKRTARKSDKKKNAVSEDVVAQAEEHQTADCIKSANDEIVEMLAQDNIKKNLREARSNLFELKLKSKFSSLAYAGLPDVWFQGMIPEKKLYNAHVSMMVKEDEHIVQVDATVWGGNKEGLVVTNRAVYYKNSFEVPHRIVWRELKSCSLSGNNIDFGEHGCFNWIGNAEARNAFYKLLSELIAEIQADPSIVDF